MGRLKDLQHDVKLSAISFQFAEIAFF